MNEADWLKLLLGKLTNSRDDLTLLRSYYDSDQPLSFWSPMMQAEFGDRLRPLVFGWPELVVNSLEERLDVEGFRLAGSSEPDGELWRIWQANNLDEASQLAHQTALVEERSFISVGSNAEDAETPVIRVESPRQVAASWEPQTRQVRAAVKAWTDPETKEAFATLYLPNLTVWYKRERQTSGKYLELKRDAHNLGRVPMVPLPNRPTLLKPEGRSEISVSLRALTDAANKIGTDMMVSAEFHAMPRRWVIGATEKDFTDEQGRQISTWQKIAGDVWGLSNAAAKVGQFDETPLTNFHNTITALAEQLAALGCLPPHYVGLLTQNPASADAIRSAETRLIMRAQRVQRTAGGAWEEAARLALRIQTGKWDPDLTALETIWRDPSTPTVAQAADAAVKLYSAGLVPRHQTREGLGYSQVQIERMEAEDAAALASGVIPQLFGPPKPMPAPPSPDGVPEPTVPGAAP